jgi:hypothetical protein
LLTARGSDIAIHVIMSDDPELPGDEHSLKGTRDWPHAPPHRLMDGGVYYVHQNPVHHKLVPLASQWPWCSAAEFKQAVSPAWLRTIMSFRYDQIAKADGE